MTKFTTWRWKNVGGPAAALMAALTGLHAHASSVAAPLFQYAIFYNGTLEFSTCSPMTINGLVRCNTNIYVGAGAAGTLVFNQTVTAAGTISAPTNNGANWGNPYNFNSGWRTTFNGSPAYITNAPAVNLFYWSSNPHGIIDQPPAAEDPTSPAGQERLYNQAQVLVLVSNLTATTNITLTTLVRQKVGGNVPGADPSPLINVYTNPSPSFLALNLPFLSLTNKFYDGREKKTNLTAQIDVGKYAGWLATNSGVLAKFPAGSNAWPTILYVADNRTTLSNQLTVVRLTNGIAPPQNGGLGFSVATPNPLYVWGNYNCTNAAFLGTTNTSASVPCGLYCDALTLLSSNWKDANSFSAFSTGASAWNASATNTVNAALLAGIVPSTGSDNQHFSGGVHNLARLLEDWSGCTLWLNTSIVNLYNSARATNQFLNPNAYYVAPSRRFSFDVRFTDPNGSMPPGTPMIIYNSLLTILTQPQGQSVAAGQTATFSVIADGVPTLRYQWLLDGVSLPGATNSSLVISNVSPAVTGNYSVCITNLFGSLTTSNAPLVLNCPPSILCQPSNQVALAGGDVLFQAAASGPGPLGYQWYFDGTNAIANATNAVLSLTSVPLNSSGQYSVVITNAFGTSASSNVTLTVYATAAPTLANFSYATGSGSEFLVTGVPGYSYVVQASTNLYDWVYLCTNTAPFSVMDTNTSLYPQRFYRAAWLGP